LQIEQTQKGKEDEDDDMYFDKEMLERDLVEQDKWRSEAEAVLGILEDDEVSLAEDGELRKEFNDIKKRMNRLPLYDKDLSTRI
jgi:uncharacterized sporulation protein YeaH/YhbH (DUF444 family)